MWTKQIQASDRAPKPLLPLRPGLPERQTHDYERHGSTTLFAALNVIRRTVLGHGQLSHRHQQIPRFLDRLAASVNDRGQDDTHRHGRLQNSQTPQSEDSSPHIPAITYTSTPTGSSWLNQIERWFAESPPSAFAAVPSSASRNSTRAIRACIHGTTRTPKLFRWILRPLIDPEKAQEI